MTLIRMPSRRPGAQALQNALWCWRGVPRTSARAASVRHRFPTAPAADPTTTWRPGRAQQREGTLGQRPGVLHHMKGQQRATSWASGTRGSLRGEWPPSARHAGLPSMLKPRGTLEVRLRLRTASASIFPALSRSPSTKYQRKEYTVALIESPKALTLTLIVTGLRAIRVEGHNSSPCSALTFPFVVPLNAHSAGTGATSVPEISRSRRRWASDR